MTKADHKRGRRIFSENVRRLRNERGLSQEKLAFAAEVDRTHIARIETQGVNVSLDIVFALADALDVDVRELFCPREEWDEEGA